MQGTRKQQIWVEVGLLIVITSSCRVSDAGIRYMVEGATCMLQELNLTNCAKLSDVTPLRISQK